MLPILTLDERIFRFCYDATGAGQLLPVMIAASILGSGWTMFALVPLLARVNTRKWALALTVTLLATAVMVFSLKAAVGRPRPIVALAGVHPLYGAPTDFSFPSGHSAGSFATAAFVSTVAWFRARREPAVAMAMYGISAAMMTLAVLIGYSRVYLGVHFPGDVLMGAVLGGSLGGVGGYVYATKLARDDVPGAD
ncbi:phosphatase PAP2 family protein [Pendulispora brunnea]|uniref:Phosphatase PAP2 family protein n=1 Tax=Pendulispora brunnea TaxID=2905690 RepID=A0ABZ2K6G4_9BACT